MYKKQSKRKHFAAFPSNTNNPNNIKSLRVRGQHPEETKIEERPKKNKKLKNSQFLKIISTAEESSSDIDSPKYKKAKYGTDVNNLLNNISTNTQEESKIINIPIPKRSITGNEEEKLNYFGEKSGEITSIQLENLCILKTKKKRVKDAVTLYRKIKHLCRFKDKRGKNIKEHCGLWKYYYGEDKKLHKYYISWECEKSFGGEARVVAKHEKAHLERYKNMLGKIGYDPHLSKTDIRYWGIPNGIADQLRFTTHIVKLFDWQVECLEEIGDKQKNMIYFAPTSGGKSIIAEIVMIRAILAKKKRVLYVLPYVSIVSEKYEYLSKILSTTNIKILQFHGQVENGWSANCDIAICTLEKANSIFNRLIEEGNYEDASLLILDEFHMIEDHSRGYLLELLITKIKLLQSHFPHLEYQILGMSATLGKLNSLSKWLNNASIFKCNFRPVPLNEYIKIGNELYNINFKQVAEIKTAFKNDSDDITQLVSLYLKYGNQILIFCATKKCCEVLANKLANKLPQFYPKLQIEGSILDLPARIRNLGIKTKEIQTLHQENNPEFLEVKNNRENIVNELLDSPVGLCKILKETIPQGIAYHHSGLTTEERKAVEQGYKNGALRIIVATSTLSTGINLPAKVVIFRTPYIGLSFLDPPKYKQMAGRAGRTGLDSKGEVILICKPNEIAQVKELYKPLKESLKSGVYGRNLCKGLIECIGCGILSTLPEVRTFLECTLCYHLCQTEECAECIPHLVDNQDLFSNGEWVNPQKFLELCSREKEFFEGGEINCRGCLETYAKRQIAFFLNSKFIIMNGKQKALCVSPLGKATMGSSLPPNETLEIMGELGRARLELRLDTDIELLFLCVGSNCLYHWEDWLYFINNYKKLSKGEIEFTEKIGITLENIYYWENMSENRRIRRDEIPITYKKLYICMIMNLVLKEYPLGEICKQMGITRGVLQSIQYSVSSYSGMLAQFCERLHWVDLSLLLISISDRLNFGVKQELLELVKLPLIRPQKARALYNEGITNMEELAASNEDRIYEILFLNERFLGSKGINDSEIESQIKYCEYLQRLCHNIIIEANMLQDKEDKRDNLDVEGYDSDLGDLDREIDRLGIMNEELEYLDEDGSHNQSNYTSSSSQSESSISSDAQQSFIQLTQGDNYIKSTLFQLQKLDVTSPISLSEYDSA